MQQPSKLWIGGSSPPGDNLDLIIIKMRTLLLFRWAPWCGKSTFIKEHWLEPYTLCADTFRMLYSSPTLYVNGEVHIPQNVNGVAWDNLFSCLEYRMQNGEFTVIDATNSKTVEMNKYKKLADEYRYRLYIVDMTDIPIEEVKRRNKLRPEWKWVPEEAIDNMYSRFSTQKIPSWIKVIKPEEVNDLLRWRAVEIPDTYKEVVHIGDIHWCYETLMSALPNGIEEDKFYIFLWDYYERGPEDVKTLDFMESIIDLPNVVCLEWNHETHLWTYGIGKIPRSKHFMGYTVNELIEWGWDAKRMRIFMKKLLQCYYYTFKGKTVLCTHWWISNSNFEELFPLGLTCLATIDLIHWVGSYNDTWECDSNFAKGDILSCHWHRNIEDKQIEWIANLEWWVEWGKELRVAILNDKLEIVKYPYKDRIPSKEEFFWVKQDITVKQFIESLRKNKYINEKNVQWNISSFNFTRWAFSRSHWDRETVKARWLFINTNTYKIVARAYNKFFNVDEQKSTMLFSIGQNAHFPIVGYKKYNGYLWIIWYDEESDELVFTSKSEVGWPHAQRLKEIVIEKGIDLDKVKDYLKENFCSLVFEVIDPVNDAHIIKYTERDVILLDCVKNTINFEKLDYNSLLKLGEILWFTVKEKLVELKDMVELRECIDELLNPNSEYNTWTPIEWMVFVDKDDFMFKQKWEYYQQWKKLRALIWVVARWQNFTHTWMLTNPEMNEFYWWLKEQALTWEENIIELRDKFYTNKAMIS